MDKIAYMFAGQGAQYPGMGLDLYSESPAARRVFDMGESTRPGTLEMCFHGSQDDLTRTVNAQPCLFLTDLAAARALDEINGFRASAAAGFSLGEIAALAYCGVLSDTDAFHLVCARGEAMDRCSLAVPGGMAAVLRLGAEKVEYLCGQFDGVYPVNYNCPGQIACAGKKEMIEPFCAAVKEAGGRAVPIAVSGAFHTRFMAECADKLAELLAKTDVSAPEIPMYSNYTGERYPSEIGKIRDNIALQCMNPVRWEKSVRAMGAETDIFIEVGAGKTLSGLCRKILPEAKILNVSDMESLQNAAKELANG